MTAEHEQKGTNLEELLKSLDAEPEPETASVERIVAGLREQRFFGIVELTLEAGRIVLVRKKETARRGR